MKQKFTLLFVALVWAQFSIAQWSAVPVSGLSPGTGISYLYYDGSIFWAGGIGQIFKSTDGGSNWTNASTGLQSGISGVSGIVKLENRVYASFIGNGNYYVYYTTDGGNNWIIDTAGWNSIAGVVPATVQLSTHKNYVVARCESNFIMYKKNTDPKWNVLPVTSSFRTPGGFYTVGDSLFLGLGYVTGSTDMGANWSTPRSSAWPSGMPMGFINGWFQDAANPSRIYGNYQVLSTSKPILFVSNNNQLSWDSIHMDVPQPTLITSMLANGNEVYAAYNGSFTAGDTTHKMFHSADGGKTWTNITGNLYSYSQFKFHYIKTMQMVNGNLFAAGFSSTGLVKYATGASGLEQNKAQENLMVYPNPAKDLLRLNQLIDAFTLTDISGKVILQQTQLNNSEINLQQVPAGLYFLSVVQEEKQTTFKVVLE